MAEYIEREALVHHFMTTRRYLTKDLVMDAAYEVSKFPAADVAPVMHGRRVPAEQPKKVTLDSKCAECASLMLSTDKYCPNCGARMDGE